LTDHVPHGHWKTITFIAGLRRRAMVAPFVLDGPMNATSFMAYLKQCLAPTLKRGDIVMMDSLPVHKVAGVRASSGEMLPPLGLAAMLPVSFKRCIHLIAELALTSTHSAASRRDAPASTSRSTRIRKSSEQGLGIDPLQKSTQCR
jgi:hypothetical protein